jgi:ABC-type uncharacterized transport system involved in gliding motility auxiliary subunit
MSDQPKPTFRNNIVKWIVLIFPIVVVFGIFVFIDIIASNHNWNWDITPEKRYTPSDQTIQLLKALKDDVTFTTFYKFGDFKGLDGLYQQMQVYSKHFKYQLIDFDRNPAQARVYNVAKYGDTVVQYKDKRMVFTYPTEGQIVNTVVKLTGSQPKVIYFTKGHGEKDINEEYSELKEAFETEAWVVKAIWLMSEDAVPDDASLVVVGGPEKDFGEHELNLLSDYLSREGKVVFLIEPFTHIPRLVKFLDTYQLRLADDVIVDKVNKLSGGEFLTPLISIYSPHPITRSLKSASVFSTARSIGVKTGNNKAINVYPLAMSSQLSWTKTSQALKNGETDFKEGMDRKGPVPVAVLVEIKGKEEKKERKSIIICFSDADFIDNKFLDILGNKDFFLNTLNWLVWEGDLISIRPKKYDLSYHFMTERESRWCLYIPVFILPPIFLVIGLIVFIYRRRSG